MREIVFFLEEISAKEMLTGFLPKIIPDTIVPKYVVFEGKQDLAKRLPSKLRGWLNQNTIFFILHDKDSNNCIMLKNNLRKLCSDAGKPQTIIRIVCHELESWYLGDLQAVEKGLALSGIESQQNKRKFRDPDALANAYRELQLLTGKKYQKIAGSRAIAPFLSVDFNTSSSFNLFIRTLKSIIES